MKHTNKMVNIESNPLNGSSFMNDLRNKYMEKQTAVEWLEEFLKDRYTLMNSEAIFQHAKEMEKEQIMDSYWNGYSNWDNQKKAEEYFKETYK
jgi:hypothetical protein